jgi:hypothetical protein
MKKLKLLSFILFAGIILGCSRKMPVPIEGIYPVKAKTLTIFDLFSQEYRINYNVAEVVEAKPEKITIGFDLQRLSDYRFGSFRLGNNNQRTWFVMGKDDQGYWTEFYIDQNNDLKIKENEKIKSFQSGQDKVKGLDRSQSLSLIPVRIKVSYKGLAGEVQKNLYLFILTTVLSKNNASDLLVEAITASFLEGEIQVASGEVNQRIKFRLIDANGNGCFNDYGTDLIFFDLNFNDFFQQNESYRLVEFFNFQTSTGEEKQFRIIVPPYPAKVAIVEACQEYNLEELEAKSDPEETDEAEDSISENNNTEEKEPEQADKKL